MRNEEQKENKVQEEKKKPGELEEPREPVKLK